MTRHLKSIVPARGSWTANEYATVCAFSAKNRWSLFQSGDGGHVLYTGDGEPAGRVSMIAHSQEPRWDSQNPDVVHNITGNTVWRNDVTTVQSTPVQIFSEYLLFDAVERSGVQGMGEGDIENNKIALAGMRADGRRDVFLYDLARGKKGKVLTLEPDAAVHPTFNKSGRVHGLDNVYATPSGNVQIGWHQQGSERFQGVELYSADMEFIRKLTPVIGHNDVGTYQGRDVLLWCSSADPEIDKNAVVMIDSLTGDKTVLAEFDWDYAMHISACAREFCIVSTYAPNNSLPSQIWKVSLSGATPELLADTGSVMIRTADGIAYNPQPKASVSRDGSRVVYCTNRGKTDRGPTYCEAEVLILEEVAAPVEPPKEPPVVVPSPDLYAELVALRQELAESRAYAESRAADISDLEEQNSILTDTLTQTAQQNATLAQEKRTLEQQIDMLTNALVAVRSQDVDPAVWDLILFKPAELRRRWGYEVLPGLQTISMNDVDGQGAWSRIVERGLLGNRYLLRAVIGPDGVLAFEMYTAKTNANPWS